MQDPLKDKLYRDIRDFRDEKKPRAPNENKNLVRNILYSLIGLSVLGGLARIVVMLLVK
ncbi:hypothetical protein [Enterococcus cecorum]|uniref:hypothetical protein n=1 Tax=Enterococcus cecorum TaxID=44008 RepID=UPI00200A2AB5|nr:hypothetical protein [Enterococcus cecorum]